MISNVLAQIGRLVLLSAGELTILLGTFFVSLVYFKCLIKDKRITSFLDKLPGPPQFPVLGNVFSFAVPTTGSPKISDVLKYIYSRNNSPDGFPELLGVGNNLVKNYGRIVRVWMINVPYVMLASAKEMEKVLSSSTHIEKSRDYFALKPWLGNALNLAKGHQWVPRRRLLLPAFQFRFLDNFMEVFNEQSVIMKNVLEDECLDKKEVNLFPYACRCTLDVICEAAMGVKIGAQTQKDLEYLKSIVSVSNLIVKRMFRPWLHPDFIWKISPEGRAEKKYLKVLHSFTENVITERRKLYNQNKELENSIKRLNKESADDEIKEDAAIGSKKHRLAFLDLLLEVSEGGKVLTDEEIRNETDIFMVAGHDTSGSGIAWTLFLLGLHPEIQKKVQQELDDIFEGDRDRHVTVADLAKMKYLELCTKEALRLCPPIPVIFRHIYQDIQLEDGKMIPRGTSVALNLLELQRDPEVFPDPLKYDPERFLPENCIGRNAYAYVPFAAGPRNCIGMKFAQMEVKVILATLLRNFEFESTESFESVKITPDIALRPKYGLHFNLKKRC